MALNVISPIGSLGYGVCGKNIVAALERLDAEPALFPIGNPESENYQEELKRALQRQDVYNPGAPSLRIWHQFALAEHVGFPRMALPIFELDRFTEREKHHLKSQEVVFAPTHWAGWVLEQNGVPRKRIAHAPFGTDPSIFHPAPMSYPGSPTVFLNIGKWEVRKGHDVLCEAFSKAFEPTDNVILKLCCDNPFYTAEENAQWAGMFARSKMGPNTQLYPRQPSHYHIAQLMAESDCGVFPSKAEGWNLEASELLSMGRHLIITNYSGHTEFCTTLNSRLIDIGGLEPAYDGKWFHRQGNWAHFGPSQMEQLIVHLRDVHRLKQEGALGLNQAGIESMQYLTWENTARRILEVAHAGA